MLSIIYLGTNHIKVKLYDMLMEEMTFNFNIGSLVSGLHSEFHTSHSWEAICNRLWEAIWAIHLFSEVK